MAFDAGEASSTVQRAALEFVLRSATKSLQGACGWWWWASSGAQRGLEQARHRKGEEKGGGVACGAH